MFDRLAAFLGLPRAIAFVLLVSLFGIVLIVGLGVRSCTDRSADVAQTRVDTSSADAMASAAGNAVATVTASQARDKSVDAVVTQATEKIKNAPDPVAARAAVVDAVCQLRSYRNRPECTVQPTHP